MNDQLKMFTNEHREEFDLYDPSPALWDKIDTRLQEIPVKRMRTRRLRIIQAVAAAAMLAGIWFAVKAIPGFNNKKQEPVLVKETPVQQQPVQQETPQQQIPQTVPPAAEQKNEAPALASNETPKSNNAATKQDNSPRSITPAPEADPLSAYAVNKKDVRHVDTYLKKNVPQMHDRFSEDLGSLQKQYTELEQKLKTDVNRDQILNAMKRNLEMQNELVNRQLNVIKEIKELKKPKHENLPTT